ncbi:MAG: helix-hairpin-helix domain-containing protein, partial [Bacteroidaceae bacterium]|nr:helix-hairpin-helix domain-containing protein [Bacteroidaceae bacterium]
MFKVKVKQTVLIIFYLVCVVTANGQNTDWREVYERIFAADIAEESTEIDEDVMEHLDDIAAHPFNINTITQEQLEELPFLSTNESNAISLYIYRYGGMMTLQELQAIPELSYDKRQLLRYFLYCGEKEKKNSFTLKNILKHGTHDLYYGGKIPTYERRG